MSIEVTARHMEISNGTQEYARTKAEELMRVFPGIEYIHIILDHERHNKLAEIVVQARNHIKIEAEEKSDKLRGSLDSVIDKIERQMRKQLDKIQDHKLTMRKKESEKDRSLTAIND